MDKSMHNFIDSGDLSGVTTYQAGVLQAASNRALQKYCDAVLKQYGISKTQWMIIGTVLDAGPNGIRVSDLAKELGTTMSYLTNTVNLLESRNVLLRTDHGDDNRSRLITVDDSFARKCPAIEQRLRQALRNTIYAGVNPADFRIYMKVMHQLSQVDQPK